MSTAGLLVALSILFEAAATVLGRGAGTLPSTFTSLREAGRLAKTLVSFDANKINDYLKACFAAGTPILWEHGEKPVEAFRKGDRVWARNEFDPKAKAELREIEETFVTEAEIWHLHVRGEPSGVSRRMVIRTTAEHPFWVKDFGWVETHLLKPGDILIGKDGRETRVEEVLATGTWETVYNFRVAEHHTYFVGSAAWGLSIWAHNALCVTSRTGMAKSSYVNAKGKVIETHGTPQVTNGPNGSAHAAQIRREAQRLTDKIDDGYIVYNRSWGTATGGVSTSRKRPDFFIVRRLPGGRERVDAYEVASPSDDPVQLRARLISEMGTLPTTLRGRIDVF